MPVELQVIHASEFVCLDADEILDFEASQQTLQALAHACRKRGLGRALLDLRSLPVPDKPVLTPAQLAALVATFRTAGFTRQQRLAILYRQDIHGGIRNFAFFSRMRGLQVQAFVEFEAAFHWLAEGVIHELPRRENEIPIPIRNRKKEVKKLPVPESVGRPARPVRKAPHKRL